MPRKPRSEEEKAQRRALMQKARDAKKAKATGATPAAAPALDALAAPLAAPVERSNGICPSPAEMGVIDALAQDVLASGIHPPELDTAAKIRVLFVKAWELGAPLLTALKQLYVSDDGVIGMASELTRALIMRAGIGYIDPVEWTPERVTVDACRYGVGGRPDRTAKFSYEAASLSGPPTYGTVQDQLFARATSLAARAMFADVVAGVAYEPSELTRGPVTSGLVPPSPTVGGVTAPTGPTASAVLSAPPKPAAPVDAPPNTPATPAAPPLTLTPPPSAAPAPLTPPGPPPTRAPKAAAPPVPPAAPPPAATPAPTPPAAAPAAPPAAPPPAQPPAPPALETPTELGVLPEGAIRTAHGEVRMLDTEVHLTGQGGAPIVARTAGVTGDTIKAITRLVTAEGGHPQWQALLALGKKIQTEVFGVASLAHCTEQEALGLLGKLQEAGQVTGAAPGGSPAQPGALPNGVPPGTDLDAALGRVIAEVLPNVSTVPDGAWVQQLDANQRLDAFKRVLAQYLQVEFVEQAPPASYAQAIGEVRSLGLADPAALVLVLGRALDNPGTPG